MKIGFELTKAVPGMTYVRDISPYAPELKSLTNGAETLVAYLTTAGQINNGTRLFYKDTDGRVDEMQHIDGKFTGFHPGYRSETDFYSNSTFFKNVSALHFAYKVPANTPIYVDCR
jgi:hypothetical protein